MKSGIYAIWNSITNKIYVGQAVNISKRWKNHKIELKLNRHTNKYLQSAYNKDRLFLVFYVLEFCEPTQEILDKREQYHMDLYDSSNREKGYNLCPTAGGSPLGYKHSDETLEKWSKQRKGKIRGPEARAAIKAGWEKRRANGPVSEETKRKLSESHKGKTQSLATKEKRSAAMIGNQNAANYKRSPEHIAALTAGRQKARAKEIYFTMVKISIDVF